MKPWWKSKTIWFNAFMASSAAVEVSFNLLQPVLPVNVYGVALFVLTVGNVMLRFATTQSVGRV